MLGHGLSDMDKTHKWSREIRKTGLKKMKNFCDSWTSSRNWEDNPQNEKKIVSNHISDTGFVSRKNMNTLSNQQ